MAQHVEVAFHGDHVEPEAAMVGALEHGHRCQRRRLVRTHGAQGDPLDALGEVGPRGKDAVGHVAIVQVSDFLVGDELRFNRRVPGDGSIPLEWIMSALLDAGYGGVFDLEILGPVIAEEGYAAAMRRGCEWMSERLVGWGV